MRIKETIEEILEKYDIYPEESLVMALEVFIEHEIVNAKHEIVVQVMKKVNEITKC